MRVYLTYFKLKFIASLQYRASALGAILTQFFFGIVNILVFIAFFSSGEAETSMTLKETITYLWLNQSFFALICQFYKDPELFDLVKSGNISYELARPQNVYFMWYFKILATRLASVLLRCFIILLVANLLPEPYRMLAPCSLENFLLFIISLSLGALLISGISTLYPILVLKTMNEKGIVDLFSAISDILSGLVIPIPFFPNFFANIGALLPFQYVSDLPFRIYVGNINTLNGVIGMGIQIFWIIVVILIGYTLLEQSLKRVCVQGG